MKTNQKKRWKPKVGRKGGEFWYVVGTLDVCSDYWKDGVYHRGLYEVGNCFKTRKEAEAMAKKIKKLLRDG